MKVDRVKEPGKRTGKRARQVDGVKEPGRWTGEKSQEGG